MTHQLSIFKLFSWIIHRNLTYVYYQFHSLLLILFMIFIFKSVWIIYENGNTTFLFSESDLIREIIFESPDQLFWIRNKGKVFEIKFKNFPLERICRMLLGNGNCWIKFTQTGKTNQWTSFHQGLSTVVWWLLSCSFSDDVIKFLLHSH